MTIVAAVIRKDLLAQRYIRPKSPYELALLFCMERAREYLDEVVNDTVGTTHIICEARGGSGAKEDKELEEEFKKIATDGGGLLRASPIKGFDLLIADKKSNMPGLQIADLIARPIGLRTIYPDQQNRAYDVIAPKIWDRKVFP